MLRELLKNFHELGGQDDKGLLKLRSEKKNQPVKSLLEQLYDEFWLKKFRNWYLFVSFRIAT